jgi:hypothetical protein
VSLAGRHTSDKRWTGDVHDDWRYRAHVLNLQIRADRSTPVLTAQHHLNPAPGMILSPNIPRLAP